ncbi:MAG: hypothetical protein AAFN70_11065, partial [Planctomycetota bacterium]
MARRNKSKNGWIVGVLTAPLIVCAGISALWCNEVRFDYYKAAKNTVVAESLQGTAQENISTTGAMNQASELSGEYVEQFVGFLQVNRRAEIYAWHEDDSDDDRPTQWDRRWMSRLENNHRNNRLSQKFSSR